MRRPGLRVQLAVSHAALALAMVVVATAPVVAVSSQERKEAMKEGASREAESLVSVARTHGLQELAGDLSESQRRSVVLLDGAGDPLGREGPGTLAADSGEVELARRALGGEADASVVRYAGAARALAWAPVVDGEEIVGAVLVAGPRMHAFPLGARSLVLAGLGVLVVVLAGGLGWMLAGRIAGPLDTLRAAVFRLALGDLSTRASLDGVPGSPEVDALVAAFNRVVSRLDRREQEQTANRERRRVLLRQLSHRLRTPLGILLLRIEEATAAPLPAERRRALGRTLVQQVRSLEQITGEVLELAGQDHADVDPPVRVDLARAAREAVERIRPLADWRGVAVELRAEPGSIVEAGSSVLTEAATELVVNAVKFSAPGQSVEVSVRSERGRAHLAVVDRGAGGRSTAGLRPDRSGGAAGALPGSGIGLSLVSELARRSGGSLHLEDRTGGGTVATLELPAAGRRDEEP